ncbi:MAG: F0F1 ATP synthase subunit epsilon [Silicimonas sp.]|jgi:F-type H+-transporting ATPase subunit epsilon|nr:F0F1 ATP synthase subunit epsilon [Silicimonas sp.]
MADTMQFELVSPERKLASGQAVSVLIPGADGDLTAMPDHAPVVTTLRPGILVVEMDGGKQEFAVTGGFAQVTAEGATVLADEAMPKAEVSSDVIQERISAAQEARDNAQGAERDDAEKRMADLAALLDAMV